MTLRRCTSFSNSILIPVLKSGRNTAATRENLIPILTRRCCDSIITILIPFMTTGCTHWITWNLILVLTRQATWFTTKDLIQVLTNRLAITSSPEKPFSIFLRTKTPSSTHQVVEGFSISSSRSSCFASSWVSDSLSLISMTSIDSALGLEAGC